MGKQTKSSFKPINVVSKTRPLELLHMDLFGPSRTMSLGGSCRNQGHDGDGEQKYR